MEEFLFKHWNAYPLAEQESKIPEIAKLCSPHSLSCKIGDYVYSDGVISSQLDKQKNVAGIVVLRNSQKNAPVGHRGLMMLPEKIRTALCERQVLLGGISLSNGWENTQIIAQAAAEKGIKVPAVDLCLQYHKNGINPGDAFSGAKEQVSRILHYADLINPSLEKIGVRRLFHCYVSSTEGNKEQVWYVKKSLEKYPRVTTYLLTKTYPCEGVMLLVAF